MTARSKDPGAVGVARVLHPGDVACGARGECLETLLGSCVALVMTDPRRTAGAMCHIVHPAPAPAGRPHDTAHADAALVAIWSRLHARGLQPSLCEAWVYGGGNMFPELYPRGGIGERIVQQVLAALALSGVRLAHHDVGGVAYRKLAWTVGARAPVCAAVDV